MSHNTNPDIRIFCLYVLNESEQNSHIKSFHKVLKNKYVWPREFADTQDAKEVLLAAFEDYSHR